MNEPVAFDPSEPLRDRKRQRFCDEVIAGVPLYEAYTTAGFKRPRGNVHRLLAEPQIQARIKFLRDQVEPFEPVLLALRRTMLRDQLDNIVQQDRLALFAHETPPAIEVDDLPANVTAHPALKKILRGLFKRAVGGTTLRTKPFADWTPEQRALIEGIKLTKYGPELQMPSKIAALALLAKLDGLDAPTKSQVEHSGVVTMEMLVHEAQRRTEQAKAVAQIEGPRP